MLKDYVILFFPIYKPTTKVLKLQPNDMKKYSSYKSLKPLNTTINYPIRPPQTPTYSSSYHKNPTFELSNQCPSQKRQIYPMTTKHNTFSASTKKMFPSKNLHPQTNSRPLTLIKPSNQDHSLTAGYKDIRTKITDLSNRLNEIKRNYDQSIQNRKCTNSESTTKTLKQNDSSINTKQISSSKNKQNQVPKQKKTQSKLLLQRYHNNKKLKYGESVSTANLLSNLQQNSTSQSRIKFEYGRPPMSPKNMPNETFKRMIKTNIKEQKNQSKSNNEVVNDTKKMSLQGINEPVQKKQQNNQRILGKYEKQKQLTINDKTIGEQDRVQPISPKSQASYLKQYVTTFTCDNKLPLTHSTSQTNLYRPKNKLSQKVPQNLYYVSAIISAFESKSLTSFENLCKNHLNSSLEILTYIKNSKKQPPTQYTKKPLPPVKDNKNTIIFDLDQTLIHCNQNLNVDHDIALPIKFPNGQIMKAGINVRPYAKEILIQLSKYFEIIVFTASHECYGNVIVDYLDPKGELVAHRYFRDSCYKTDEGFYVKDLRVIDRDMGKMLLIDNAAYSYCFQLQNGVPIIPFYDNKADMELKNLIPYLKAFINESDVRNMNNSRMKLTQFTKFKEVKSLVTNLFMINQ